MPCPGGQPLRGSKRRRWPLGHSIDRVLKTADRLNRPDRKGERKVRIHAIGFPTIFSQARYGENTGVRFATLMRLLCERNGGAFVALNDLTP